VNLEHHIAEEEETHPYHCEKSANGTKNSLGWCDARELFREIQGLDSHIQRGDNIVLAFLPLSMSVHGLKINVTRKKVAAGKPRGRSGTLQ